MQNYKLSQFCAAVIVSTNRLVLPELLGLPTAEAPFTQNVPCSAGKWNFLWMPSFS